MKARKTREETSKPAYPAAAEIATSYELPLVEQPIKGEQAAGIVGINYPGAFNNARSRLQRAIPIRGSTAVIWVVDVWGGVKYPGVEWRYCAAKCRRAARGEF
jgi:NAD(P)-dependent dehydrogenase (short-subunit alcohol dehydrogenase family)